MLASLTPAKTEGAKKPTSAAHRANAPRLTPTGERLAFQLATGANAADAAEREADAAASAVVGTPPGNASTAEVPPTSTTAPPFGIIVDDDSTLGPGQIHRTEFLDSIGPEIERAADEELKPSGRTARDCPYLAYWLQFYRGRPAAQIERAIQRYARPERADLLVIREAVIARARTAVQAWLRSGGKDLQVPESSLEPSGRVSPESQSGVAIQRKANDQPRSRTSLPSDSAAVQSQLGHGRPLDSSVRSRMERGFGGTFDEVRVHTDSHAARMAQDYSARAFTVGTDIAFGADEYQPGTLAGEALIAHELAHVVQQRGATVVATAHMKRGQQAANPIENDADRSAMGAMVALWTGRRTDFSDGGPIAMPQLRSGLRLQRCADFQTAPDIEQRLGLSIDISPDPSDGKTYIVGQKIKLSIAQKMPTEHMVMVYHWAGIDSRGNEMRGYGPTLEPQIFWPGTTTIRAEIGISVGNNTIQTTTLERKIEAVWAKDRAKERVEAAGAPPEFAKFRAGQDINLALLSPDNTPSPTQAMFVTSSANNPAPLNSGSASFGLGYPPGQAEPAGRTFHWYAFPMSAADMPPKLGAYGKTTVEGREGFDLGTGRTAELPTISKGIFVVTCYSFDGAHKAAEASWVQTILDTTEIEATADLKSEMAAVDAKLSQFTKTPQGNPDLIAVTAFHVSGISGTETQLSMFIGKRPDGTVVMLNATPGLKLSEHRIEFTGSSTSDVLDDFNSHNKYPPGAIRFHIPGGKIAGIDGADRTVNTTGETRLGAIASVLGFAALVLSIAAIPFTGGASATGTMILLGASTVGVAAGAFSLADHLSNERFSTTSVVLDCLQIAASAIDLGVAFKALRSSPALVVANRAVRYAMWTSLGVQGASALLISVDAIDQIARIVEDQTLSRSQKLSALTRLIATLIVTGALLALSYKSMGEAKARMKEQFGARGAALKDLDAAALGLVDDAILKNLKAASLEDLERLAAMIRGDPALVTRLGGTKNLLGALKGAKNASAADLETRLFSQRLTAVGATGKSAGRIADAVNAAGIDPAAAHLLTDDDIARLAKADASFAKARNLRDSDPVKASSTAAARAEMDAVTGVSSATRDSLRAGLAHVHGMPDPAFAADPLVTLRARFPKVPPDELSALATLDRDALLSLEAASEGDIRAVIKRLKRNSNADVQDLLKSFYYKQRKPTRKEGEVYVPPNEIGDKLGRGLDVLAKVRARGWPNGFATRADFDTFVLRVKSALAKRGIPDADVRVHGSALHNDAPQDIDVAVLVDDASFKGLAARFEAAAPKTQKANVIGDVEKGRIASSNFFPDVKPSAADEVANVGTKLSAQVSVIKHGSEFDLGPYLR